MECRYWGTYSFSNEKTGAADGIIFLEVILFFVLTGFILGWAADNPANFVYFVHIFSCVRIFLSLCNFWINIKPSHLAFATRGVFFFGLNSQMISRVISLFVLPTWHMATADVTEMNRFRPCIAEQPGCMWLKVDLVAFTRKCLLEMFVYLVFSGLAASEKEYVPVMFKGKLQEKPQHFFDSLISKITRHFFKKLYSLGRL